MRTKQQEFTELVEFIEVQFGIKLQPYQKVYLKYLVDNQQIYLGGRQVGKTALFEKYIEFKKLYEKDSSDFGINPAI